MTYTLPRTSPLKTLSLRLRGLGAGLRSAWRAGPVPCWTEYLHETQDQLS